MAAVGLSFVRAFLLAVCFAVAGAHVGCAAPIQNGGVVVQPGAVQRFLLAMRLGYGGAGEARPSARVRRVALDGDVPSGKAAAAQRGDWLLENELVTVVVGDVGTPRAGQLLDVAPAPSRRDAFGALVTQVAGGGVRWRTAKGGEDATTGSAWVVLTGYAEAEPAVQVSTRYDLSPDLQGVLVHTSITGPEGPLGAALGVGDVVGFGASGGRVELGPHDAATVGGVAGYLVAPLGDPPFVVTSSAPGEATVGVAGSSVELGAQEPYIYSRAVLVLERPDALALAATRAMATGQAVGEVEIELVARLRAGEQVDAGKVRFERGGLDAPLELETKASKAGDRRTVMLPAGSYRISFAGGAWRAPPKQVWVGARGLTPVRLPATRDVAAPSPPPSLPAPAPVPVPDSVPAPDAASDADPRPS